MTMIKELVLYANISREFPEVRGEGKALANNAIQIIHEDGVPDGTVIAIVDLRLGVEAAKAVAVALGGKIIEEVL